MRVLIDFDTGVSREYFLQDHIVEEVVNGKVLNIKLIHPDFGEMMIATVESEGK